MENTLVLENISVDTRNSLESMLADRYYGKYNPNVHGLIFERKVHASRSEKYVQINTGDILAELMNQGVSFNWQILKMVYRRKDGKRELDSTSPHIVAIYFDTVDSELKDLGKIAFYIINSADGSKALRGVFGWLNGACLNGCVFSEFSFVDVLQRHIGENARKLVREDISVICSQIKETLASGLASMVNNIKEMTKTSIKPTLFREFAKEAFQLRLKYSNIDPVDTLKGESVDNVDFESIEDNHMCRTEFADGSVWSAYQLVQENLRGNFQFEQKRALPKIRFTVTRQVTNESGAIEYKTKKNSIRNSDEIGQKVKFNQELFALVGKYLEMSKEQAVM